MVKSLYILMKAILGSTLLWCILVWYPKVGNFNLPGIFLKSVSPTFAPILHSESTPLMVDVLWYMCDVKIRCSKMSTRFCLFHSSRLQTVYLYAKKDWTKYPKLYIYAIHFLDISLGPLLCLMTASKCVHFCLQTMAFKKYVFINHM